MKTMPERETVTSYMSDPYTETYRMGFNPDRRTSRLEDGIYWVFLRGCGWRLAQYEGYHKLPWKLFDYEWSYLNEDPFSDRTVDLHIYAYQRMPQPDHPRVHTAEADLSPTHEEIYKARQAALEE